MRSIIRAAIAVATTGLLAGCANDLSRYGVQGDTSADVAEMHRLHDPDNPAVPAGSTIRASTATDQDPYIRQQSTGFGSSGAARGVSGVNGGGTTSSGASVAGGAAGGSVSGSAVDGSGTTSGYISGGGGTGYNNGYYDNGVYGNAVIIPNNNGQVPNRADNRSIRQQNGVTGNAPAAADRGGMFSGNTNTVAPNANDPTGAAAGAMRNGIRNNTPGPNNSIDPNTNTQFNRQPNRSTGMTGTTGGTAGTSGGTVGSSAAQGGSSGGAVGSSAAQGGSSGGTAGSSAAQGGSSGGNAGSGAATGGSGGASGGSSGGTSGSSGGAAGGGARGGGGR